MEKFLSCDWGTTSFRLRLVNVASLAVLAELQTDDGIANTFNLWKESKAANRIAFYQTVLRDNITRLEKTQDCSLERVPVVVSGMASSSIGIINLPYASIPFHVNGLDARVKRIKSNVNFNHGTVLISGICSDTDVMRGEETQLMGCIPDDDTTHDRLFIFPGTHSKHILVRNQHIMAFKTYMTGEIFDLLSNKSILKNSVNKAVRTDEPNYIDSFNRGIAEARNASLLHALFKIRTNDLFGKFTKEENSAYLSGLLIGAELQDMMRQTEIKICLCCSSALHFWYSNAIKTLGFDEDALIFPPKWVDGAVIRGQYKVLSNLEV